MESFTFVSRLGQCLHHFRMLAHFAMQRGELTPQELGQSVFSAAGIRKEVNAVLEQVETSSQKLGKSMDETLMTVAQTRAAIKLMPEAASALVSIGRDRNSSEADAPLPPDMVRLSRVLNTRCLLTRALCRLPQWLLQWSLKMFPCLKRLKTTNRCSRFASLPRQLHMHA